MEIDLKKKELLKGLNPMMVTAIKGLNKTFGLMDKLTKKLKEEDIITVVLRFDKNKPCDNIENPPFDIEVSKDDLLLKIKQLEYKLSKLEKK